MKTWKVESNNPVLKQFIDCYWYLEKSSEDVVELHPKLIANPAMHLIIAGQEQPYLYSQDVSQSAGLGCHLLYPVSKSTQLHHSHAFSIIGVKFLPGAAFALAGLLPQVVVNKVEDFNNKQMCLLLQAYLFKGDVEQQEVVRLLDESLLPFCQQVSINKHYQQNQQCLQLLAENKTIKQLAEQLFFQSVRLSETF